MIWHVSVQSRSPGVCRKQDFGGATQDDKKIITIAEREMVVKSMWRDSAHKTTAMRFNVTFNCLAQSLGRKMEAPRLQLRHLSLIRNEDFAEDVADHCRLLGMHSFSTDKGVKDERNKGAARHKNFHLLTLPQLLISLLGPMTSEGRKSSLTSGMLLTRPGAPWS